MISVKRNYGTTLNDDNRTYLYYNGGCGDCRAIWLDKTLNKYVYRNTLQALGTYYHDIDYNDNKLPLTGWYKSDDTNNIINLTSETPTGEWIVLNGIIKSDNFGKINFTSSNFEQIPVDLQIENNINYNQYLTKNYPQIDKIFSGPSSFSETTYHLGLLKTDGTLLLSGANDNINYIKNFTSEVTLTGAGNYNGKYIRNAVFQTGKFYPNGDLTNENWIEWNAATNTWNLRVENGAATLLLSNNLITWEIQQSLGGIDNPQGLNIKKYLDDISGEIKDLQFGLNHALLLKKDGTIKYWGDNQLNQLNFTFSTDIKQIAANGNVSILLTSGNMAYYYGSNNYGNQDAIDTNVKFASAPNPAHTVYIYDSSSPYIKGYKERGRIAISAENIVFSANQNIRDIVYSEKYPISYAEGKTFVRDNYNQVYMLSGDPQTNSGKLIKISGFGVDPTSPFQAKDITTSQGGIEQKEIYIINQYDGLAKYNPDTKTFNNFSLNNLSVNSFKEIKDSYALTGTQVNLGWTDPDYDSWEWYEENYFGSSNYDQDSVPSIATADYGKYQYSGNPWQPTGFNIIKGKGAGGIVTAISPRWGIGNQHAPATVGSSIDFDGTTVTVEAAFNINPNNQNCDLKIYRLSSDLPSGKYYPLPASNKNITGAWSIAADAQDKELPAIVLAEVTCGLGSTLSNKYILTTKLKGEQLVGGDSSNPIFIFAKNNQPILASAHWYIASCAYCQSSTPSLTPYLSISNQCVGGPNLKHPDIQALISGKITEYNDTMFETL
jgi:hypothetical protein